MLRFVRVNNNFSDTLSVRPLFGPVPCLGPASVGINVPLLRLVIVTATRNPAYSNSVPEFDLSGLTPVPLESTLLNETNVESQRARLRDIARALQTDQPVPPITVRAFLSWFWHSQRRGRWIVSYIRNRLDEAGLRTIPDFEATYLDAEILFVLASQEIRPSSAPSEEPAEVVKIANLPEVTVPTATFADPTYRISKLAAANKRPISVNPDSSLAEAITLMMANDFSQLPVSVNERDVKGIVSWKSIGSRLALGQSPQWTRDVMDPHAEISSEASLFTAIPMIVEYDYALVRAADKRIVGVITTSDLSLQFQQLSEPFLLLGEIENHIRKIISARFTPEQLAAAKDPADGIRSVESASDLTFGEYKRLLEDPSMWSNLNLALDRSVFIQLLEKVRLTRNDVMHFDPDGIEGEALTVLREFVKFLRTLQTIGAT
jgi:CBS domain-containing protein